MATLLQFDQFFDDAGAPLSSGVIESYIAGTSTPQNMYADQAGTPLGTTVTLSTAGRVPTTGIWLDGAYKLVIKNSTGTIQYTFDNVNLYDQLDWTGLTATIADLNSTVTTAFYPTFTAGRYTVTPADRGKMILVDASSGDKIVDMLATGAAADKYIITIKKVDTTNNTVRIDGGSPTTIDGLSTDYYLRNYNDSIMIHCDGSEWFIMAAKLRRSIEEVKATQDVTLADELKIFLGNASSGSFDLKLPAPPTVGSGYMTTAKKIDSSGNSVNYKPNGSETIDGASSFSLVEQYDAVTLSTDGTNWHIISDIGDVSAQNLPIHTRQGFRMENYSVDPTHDIKLYEGEGRSDTNTRNIILRSPITKRIDASWQEGSGNGGFPVGLTLTGDTWYHFFTIVKPNGQVDAGWDSNLDANKLLADASAYDAYQIEGSCYVNSSLTIDPFICFVDNSGRKTFYWKTAVPATYIDTPLTGSITVRTPHGRKTEAILDVELELFSAKFFMYSPDAVLPTVPIATTAECAGQFFYYTGTTSNLNYKIEGTGGTFYYTTIGWRE